MLNRIKIHTLTIALIMVFLVGCNKEYDMSKIPLYDDVLFPKEPEDDDPRRTPPKNPLIMPPGYQKPKFNNYPGDDSAGLRGISRRDKETELGLYDEGRGYPKLSSIPPRPNVRGAPDNASESAKDLEIERLKALLKQKEMQGDKVPQSMMAKTPPPPLTGMKGEDQMAKKPESLRDPVKPITFDAEVKRDVALHPEYEESYASKAEREAAGEDVAMGKDAGPTHEFGTPELVKDGQHSSITHMYQVGYDSEEEMLRDQEQFRLPSFQFKNTPRINKPKPEEQRELTLNDTVDYPSFLPESRYKDRRVRGPHYKNTYNGNTYFSNEY